MNNLNAQRYWNSLETKWNKRPMDHIAHSISIVSSRKLFFHYTRTLSTKKNSNFYADMWFDYVVMNRKQWCLHTRFKNVVMQLTDHHMIICYMYMLVLGKIRCTCTWILWRKSKVNIYRNRYIISTLWVTCLHNLNIHNINRGWSK